MGKKVTDEKLVAALVINGSIKDTAANVGLNPRTVRDRMKAPETMELYKSANADIIAQALVKCQENITGAVDCITGIMQDKKVNAQTRLQAAQTILNKTVQLYEAAASMRESARNETKSVFDDLFKDF